MSRAPTPRLTIVTLTLDLGGTERHIAEIAPMLAAHGLDVTIACLGRQGAQAGAVAQKGVRVVGPRRMGTPFGASARGSGQALAAGLAILAKELATRRPDIAHFFLPLPYLAGSEVARLCRVPHLVMSRRSQNDYQRKRPAAARREHRLHRRMDLILANSRRVYDELIGEGADPARTGLIYNGLDLNAFGAPPDRSAGRRRLGIPADALVLAIVANLNPYKGHADLITALTEARLPEPWRLLVIGRDDGIGAALQSETSAAGIGSNILWLGARTDVPELLSLADIGLNVSHEEGFSNAVIEGMAAGLPMLVSDVGGNAEAIGDGVCGLVVPPRSPSAIAAALRQLAGDSASRHRMGKAARRRAAAHFSLEACVDRYLKAYRAVLAGQPMPETIDPRRTRLAGTGDKG